MRQEDIVTDPAPDSALRRASEVARRDATDRLKWMNEQAGAAPTDLLGAIPADLVPTAVNSDDRGLIAFIDGEGPSQEVTPPSRFRSAHALRHGGVLLSHPGRFSAVLADLVDDIARARNAMTDAFVLSGSITTDSPELANAHQLLVVALSGEVRVGTDDMVDGEPVRAGRWLRSDRATSLRTSAGDQALIVGSRQPTHADVWASLIRKAGYWPRLRADLPYDLFSPVTVYGEPEPIDVVAQLTREFAQLESAESTAETFAQFRARIRPAQRPLADLDLLPDSPEEWATRVVKGRFPGGVGVIGSRQPDSTCVAVAGCGIFVHDHLLESLARLIEGRSLRVADLVTDCPVNDPACIGRALDALQPLGLVDVLG